MCVCSHVVHRVHWIQLTCPHTCHLLSDKWHIHLEWLIVIPKKGQKCHSQSVLSSEVPLYIVWLLNTKYWWIRLVHTTCDQVDVCTNTEGSFTCSCNIGPCPPNSQCRGWLNYCTMWYSGNYRVCCGSDHISVWAQMIPTTVNVILATHWSLMAIRVDVVGMSPKEQSAASMHHAGWSSSYPLEDLHYMDSYSRYCNDLSTLIIFQISRDHFGIDRSPPSTTD